VTDGRPITGEHPVVSRPITGEQQAVQVLHDNSGPTWKWLIGAFLALLVPLGSGLVGVYVGMSSGIARLEERMKAMQKELDGNWANQVGLNLRFDDDLREAQKDIIKLESKHRRR